MTRPFKNPELYKIANQDQGPFTFLSPRERALVLSAIRAMGGGGTVELTISDADFEAATDACITTEYDPADRRTGVTVRYRR